MKYNIFTREHAIELLLSKVEGVINNNDWPTEEGHVIDDGVTCTCPLQILIDNIRAGD